jgi:hypothetical protein
MIKKLKPYKTLLKGFQEYRKKGTTSEDAYQALVKVFCTSGGRVNRLLNFFITRARRPYKIAGESLVLDAKELKEALQRLNEDGYYIFKKRLCQNVCDKLTNFAKTTQTKVHPPGSTDTALYAEKSPLTETMRLPESQLLKNNEIRNWICDPGLVRLAQDYLGAQPRIDHIGMWWSIARNGDPSKEGAQEYHFDLDRIRFLQIFVYLTDCGTNDGPHCFVRGTHRPSKKTANLLKRGYARIPDSDIGNVYPKKDAIEILGERGTVFAVDTTAFHKGKKPVRHDRLVLQTVFCSSLFGANKPKLEVSLQNRDSLARFALEHPEFLERFQAQ